MYRNAILYKGVWLAPGSQALQLYSEKKFKELDEAIKVTMAKCLACYTNEGSKA